MPGHLHSVPDPPAALPGLDPRIHDALCDLYAYVLVLDAEWRRLEAHLQILHEVDTPAERRLELVSRERELREELAALRAMMARLRRSVDPHGLYL